jgi:hypothetical protein
MTQGTRTGIVCALVLEGFVGCGSYSSPPTAPAQVQPPPVVAQPAAPPAAPPSPGAPYGPGYVLTAVSLSGVVTERTAAGQTPLEDVRVYCDACGAVGHTWQFTDKNGRYTFHGDLASGGGVWLAPAYGTPLFVEKDGFVAVMPPADAIGQVSVKMNGNTEFDVQLQRR